MTVRGQVVELARAARLFGVVGAARLLAKLPPGKLERAMGFIATGAKGSTRQEALDSYEAVIDFSERCAGRWCLQRSIATALLCRSRGHWPDWHSGACLMPFRAHAWIAVDGVPVGEDPALMEYFRPLLSVTATTTSVEGSSNAAPGL